MHPSRTAGSRIAVAPFTGRAQFSPLRRATTLNAPLNSKPTTRRSAAAASGTPAAPATAAARTIAVAPVPASARLFDWWNPRLLDRLQAPLSRIRE